MVIPLSVGRIRPFPHKCCLDCHVKWRKSPTDALGALLLRAGAGPRPRVAWVWRVLARQAARAGCGGCAVEVLDSKPGLKCWRLGSSSHARGGEASVPPGATSARTCRVSAGPQVDRQKYPNGGLAMAIVYPARCPGDSQGAGQGEGDPGNRVDRRGALNLGSAETL